MAEVRPDTEARPAGYERSDMRPRVVGLFLLALTVGIGIVLLVAAWLFRAFEARTTRRDAPPSPLAVGRPVPPEPRLLVTPGQDRTAIQAAEDAVLHSYGWVDQKAGIVRVPIDRAMDLLLERGLPARPGNPGQARAR